MAELSYLTKTMMSIIKNCRARNLNLEQAREVIGLMEIRFNKLFSEMHEGDLRRVNRDLPSVLLQYLNGAKRGKPLTKEERRALEELEALPEA